MAEHPSAWDNSAKFSDNMSVISDLTLPTASGRRSVAQDPQVIDSNVTRRGMPDKRPEIGRLAFEKVGLVARDAELNEIREVYKTCQRSVILLKGESGAGKSALAQEALIATSADTKGFVGQGKWSLTDTNEPLAVLRELMHQVAGQIQKRNPNLKEKILEEFKEEMHVVQAWMPSLLMTPDGGDSSAADEPKDRATMQNNSQSIEQLQFATTTLLSLINDPIVLLVDDAQWADEASLTLLYSWAANDRIQQLLILVCYRSEIDDGSHLLTKMFLDPIEEAARETKAFSVTRIEVQGFKVDQTRTFISSLLGRDEMDTVDLAEHLQKKTGGNPFYLVSFVRSLVDESLLNFNLGSMSWTWELDAVQKATNATENVVEIVQKKLIHSDEARSLLPVAATLGATFSEANLLLITADLAKEDLKLMGLQSLPPASDLVLWLQKCEKEGFIDRISTPSIESSSSSATGEMSSLGSTEIAYRFVHDRIQEAALALVKTSDLNKLQFHIGKILADALYEDDGSVAESASDYRLFTAVNLLNRQTTGGGSPEYEASSHAETAHLNFAAGKRAMSNASFALANGYLNTAIDALTEEIWEQMPNLCIEILTSAASAAYSAGDITMMRRHIDKLVARDGVALLDKIPAFHIGIQSDLSAEKNAEACSAAMALLEELGVRFPKSKMVITFSTIKGLLEMKGVALRLGPEDIEKLEVVSDKKEMAIVKTLDLFSVAAFSWRQDLIPLVFLKMVRRTLRYGLTQHSCIALGMLGILMASGLEDFAATKACCELGLLAQKRCRSAAVEARFNYVVQEYLCPWISPLQNSLRPLTVAYRQGLFSGDLESAGFAIMFMVENALHTGRPLELVDADCAIYAAQLRDYSQLKQLRFLKNYWRVCRILRGLPDDVFDLQAAIRHLAETKDLALEVALRRSQMFLAGSMGNFEECAKLATDWADLCVKTLPGQAANIRVRFHAALSGLIMAQKGRREYKRLGFKNAAIVHNWMKKGNPNCLHLDAFLDAEKARLRSQTHTAIKTYESAIVLAGRRGMVHEQALASERYADLLFQLGEKSEGRNRLQDAIKSYTEWGAIAKVTALDANISTAFHGERR